MNDQLKLLLTSVIVTGK